MSIQKVTEATLQISFFCVLLGAVMASSGCCSLPSAQNLAIPTAATAATQAAEPQGVYEVQMQGGFSKASVSRGVIDGPITVQTVLERSGAIDKFRNMDITVMRVVKENGQGLRLPVDYQPGKKLVRTEQNYAIHPNDRILISSRANSTLDKVIDQVTRK